MTLFLVYCSRWCLVCASLRTGEEDDAGGEADGDDENADDPSGLELFMQRHAAAFTMGASGDSSNSSGSPAAAGAGTGAGAGSGAGAGGGLTLSAAAAANAANLRILAGEAASSTAGAQRLAAISRTIAASEQQQQLLQQHHHQQQQQLGGALTSEMLTSGFSPTREEINALRRSARLGHTLGSDGAAASGAAGAAMFHNAAAAAEAKWKKDASAAVAIAADTSGAATAGDGDADGSSGHIHEEVMDATTWNTAAAYLPVLIGQYTARRRHDQDKQEVLAQVAELDLADMLPIILSCEFALCIYYSRALLLRAFSSSSSCRPSAHRALPPPVRATAESPTTQNQRLNSEKVTAESPSKPSSKSSPKPGPIASALYEPTSNTRSSSSIDHALAPLYSVLFSGGAQSQGQGQGKQQREQIVLFMKACFKQHIVSISQPDRLLPLLLHGNPVGDPRDRVPALEPFTSAHTLALDNLLSGLELQLFPQVQGSIAVEESSTQAVRVLDSFVRVAFAHACSSICSSSSSSSSSFNGGENSSTSTVVGKTDGCEHKGSPAVVGSIDSKGMGGEDCVGRKLSSNLSDLQSHLLRSVGVDLEPSHSSGAAAATGVNGNLASPAMQQISVACRQLLQHLVGDALSCLEQASAPQYSTHDWISGGMDRHEKPEKPAAAGGAGSCSSQAALPPVLYAYWLLRTVLVIVNEHDCRETQQQQHQHQQTSSTEVKRTGASGINPAVETVCNDENEKLMRSTRRDDDLFSWLISSDVFARLLKISGCRNFSLCFCVYDLCALIMSRVNLQLGYIMHTNRDAGKEKLLGRGTFHDNEEQRLKAPNNPPQVQSDGMNSSKKAVTLADLPASSAGGGGGDGGGGSVAEQGGGNVPMVNKASAALNRTPLLHIAAAEHYITTAKEKRLLQLFSARMRGELPDRRMVSRFTRGVGGFMFQWHALRRQLGLSSSGYMHEYVLSDLALHCAASTALKPSSSNAQLDRSGVAAEGGNGTDRSTALTTSAKLATEQHDSQHSRRGVGIADEESETAAMAGSSGGGGRSVNNGSGRSGGGWDEDWRGIRVTQLSSSSVTVTWALGEEFFAKPSPPHLTSNTKYIPQQHPESGQDLGTTVAGFPGNLAPEQEQRRQLLEFAYEQQQWPQEAVPDHNQQATAGMSELQLLHHNIMLAQQLSLPSAQFEANLYFTAAGGEAPVLVLANLEPSGVFRVDDLEADTLYKVSISRDNIGCSMSNSDRNSSVEDEVVVLGSSEHNGSAGGGGGIADFGEDVNGGVDGAAADEWRRLTSKLNDPYIQQREQTGSGVGSSEGADLLSSPGSAEGALEGTVGADGSPGGTGGSGRPQAAPLQLVGVTSDTPINAPTITSAAAAAVLAASTSAGCAGVDGHGHSAAIGDTTLPISIARSPEDGGGNSGEEEGAEGEASMPYELSLYVSTECEATFKFETEQISANIVLGSHNPLTLRNQANKKWSTARASVRLSSGLHRWDVHIDRCVSKNIFIGVATREARLDNYVGCDRYGWAFLANKAVWHNKSKLKPYGELFRTGDTVTVILDLDLGTLSYCLNSKPLGLAIEGLSGPLYPAFSLYNEDDQLTIVQVRTIGDAAASGAGSRVAECTLDRLEALSCMASFVATAPPVPSLRVLNPDSATDKELKADPSFAPSLMPTPNRSSTSACRTTAGSATAGTVALSDELSAELLQRWSLWRKGIPVRSFLVGGDFVSICASAEDFAALSLSRIQLWDAVLVEVNPARAIGVGQHKLWFRVDSSGELMGYTMDTVAHMLQKGTMKTIESTSKLFEGNTGCVVNQMHPISTFTASAAASTVSALHGKASTPADAADSEPATTMGLRFSFEASPTAMRRALEKQHGVWSHQDDMLLVEYLSITTRKCAVSPFNLNAQHVIFPPIQASSQANAGTNTSTSTGRTCMDQLRVHHLPEDIALRALLLIILNDLLLPLLPLVCPFSNSERESEDTTAAPAASASSMSSALHSSEAAANHPTTLIKLIRDLLFPKVSNYFYNSVYVLFLLPSMLCAR